MSFIIYFKNNLWLFAEPAVNKLADDEVQTSASKLRHWLESRVPSHGGKYFIHLC